MRRGARRLPQLSQRSNGAVGSMTPSGAIVGTVTANIVGLPQDSNGPTSYWSSYSEIWELLRRVWRLEAGGPNTGGPGTGYNYVIACTFNGVFGDAQVFIRHELRVAIQFAAGFANSAARLKIGSEPTSSMAIDIGKSTDGGTVFNSVGTISYSAGNGVPTFTSTSNAVVNFAIGDILLVKGQTTHDTTGGDIGITLMAKYA